MNALSSSRTDPGGHSCPEVLTAPPEVPWAAWTDAARADYGVAVDPATLALDPKRTAALRRQAGGRAR